MIGTLVGLVQMLSTMDDPAAIGPSMAVALLTTLYGAILANVIALPISDKLSTKGKHEEVNQTLTIDGVSHLRANRSPQLIKKCCWPIYLKKNAIWPRWKWPQVK